MILVTGHIQLAPGEGERARPMLVRHMADCAAEDGCEHYSFAFDAGDPDRIQVSERWASADAIAAHGRQPHVKAFDRAWRDFTIRSIDVKAWDGAFWRQLVGG